VEDVLSKPRNKANKSINMSTARIKYRKYKSIYKAKYKIYQEIPKIVIVV
jgi:hypothetical protein